MNSDLSSSTTRISFYIAKQYFPLHHLMCLRRKPTHQKYTMNSVSIKPWNTRHHRRLRKPTGTFMKRSCSNLDGTISPESKKGKPWFLKTLKARRNPFFDKIVRKMGFIHIKHISNLYSWFDLFSFFAFDFNSISHDSSIGIMNTVDINSKNFKHGESFSK